MTTSTAAPCATHKEGTALRTRRATCKRCGWNGYTDAGRNGQHYVQGWNGKSAPARQRDVKPNGSSGVQGSTAGQYTRRISRSAERQAVARIAYQEARKAQLEAILGRFGKVTS